MEAVIIGWVVLGIALGLVDVFYRRKHSLWVPSEVSTYLLVYALVWPLGLYQLVEHEIRRRR